MKQSIHLPVIREIQIPTMEIWLDQGTIVETERGEENIYFVDQFGQEFYCKCYPQ